MSDEKPAREPIDEDAPDQCARSAAQGRTRAGRQRNRPKVQGTDAYYRSGNRALASLLGGIHRWPW